MSTHSQKHLYSATITLSNVSHVDLKKHVAFTCSSDITDSIGCECQTLAKNLLLAFEVPIEYVNPEIDDMSGYPEQEAELTYKRIEIQFDDAGIKELKLPHVMVDPSTHKFQKVQTSNDFYKLFDGWDLPDSGMGTIARPISKNKIEIMELGRNMAYKVLLAGEENQVVIMKSKQELENVSRYLWDDDRHGLVPGEITETNEEPTHESFLDWMNE